MVENVEYLANPSVLRSLANALFSANRSPRSGGASLVQRSGKASQGMGKSVSHARPFQAVLSIAYRGRVFLIPACR